MDINANSDSKTQPETRRDVATESLHIIHKTLLIDEGWTARRDRGFTWWAHRLAHHIDAGRPISDDGVVLTRITSRIPVLYDVRAASEEVEATLAELNFLADSYCYVYDPVSRSIDSVQSSLVHEGTLNWRPGLLASQFIIQLIHAEEQAPALRRKLKARLARSSHPENGRRREPDDMLRVVHDVFRPHGSGINHFADKFEFDTIFEETHQANAASFGASSTGVAVELPFGNSTALITLDAQQPHPLIGQGLGVFVQLPVFATCDAAARLAAWLNRKEAAGDLLTHCLGAWSVRKQGPSYGLVHTRFIPNALHMAGLSMDAVHSAARTVRAVNALLNPGMPEPVVWEVVANRLGLKLPLEEEQGRVKLALPN